MCNASAFDKVFVSNIFETNKDRVKILGCKDVNYGGIGSNFPLNVLPDEIERLQPFYFPNENMSYGFITRGCIRNCYFCKVPKFEGELRKVADVWDLVKHDSIYFLDNNILAYDGCIDVFKWLYEHNIKCNFNQGLDYRLVTEEKLEWLSKLRYDDNYIFAFDDIKY